MLQKEPVYRNMEHLHYVFSSGEKPGLRLLEVCPICLGQAELRIPHSRHERCLAQPERPLPACFYPLCSGVPRFSPDLL